MEITTKNLVEIESFPGYYIDREGNVYNKKLFKLKPYILRNNLCVNLKKNNYYRYVRIDKLVAKAFISNTHCYTQVGHKDGDNYNINVENLYWIDKSNHMLSIAFECFDEDKNYIASFSISQLKKYYDIDCVRQAAKSHTLYKNYYWRAIKSVDELCVPISENIGGAVYMKSDFDVSSTRDTIHHIMEDILSNKQLEIVNLYFFEEYSAIEISKKLNITKQGVYYALKHALHKMRNCKELRNLYER